MQKEITAKIFEKKELKDRNMRPYLMLKLAGDNNPNSIFVFPRSVKEYEWDELNEGETFTFSLQADISRSDF